ncbi:class I SAM-dependent methyltransferase [Candidatus Omnitrophota bacterium]
MYYRDKIKTLEEIFGTTQIILKSDTLIAGNKRYPIVSDVIILSDPSQYSDFVRKELCLDVNGAKNVRDEKFAEDIQYTFGAEWKQYDKILPEHEKEFSQNFDIVDLSALRNSRLCDLGCGNGRWSYYLNDICSEIVLVDFSDAIFVARKNLSNANNCLFFMCDLKGLPFTNNFADFLFCIGVLHTLPTPCLSEVRNFKNLAPEILIYNYYSLDNRPVHFRIFLKAVTFLRLRVSKIRNPDFRRIFSLAVTLVIYEPFIFIGRLLKPLKLDKHVPLYEGNCGKSVTRVQQDTYDRFFTGIEQRVSRKDILKLHDTFSSVTISPNRPYWHFLCKR